MLNYFNKVIFDDNIITIEKRTFVLNFIANILNAGFSSIILFIVARLGDLSLVGIVSIASTIGYQCLTIGLFGTRTIHVADTSKRYLFSDFFSIKIFSSFLMLLAIYYYSFVSEQELSKSLIIFLFGIYKCTDSFEELLHDEYHRNKRLDISSLLFIIRIILVLVVFAFVFFFTNNLIITLTITNIISLIILFIQNCNIFHSFVNEKFKFDLTKFKHLLYVLIPIFLTNYIRIYAINIPKYTINSNLNETIQAQYAILIVPIYVINLLSDIIFRPLISKISILWNTNDLQTFSSYIKKQILTIVALTLFIMVGGYVIGLKLLGIIYGYNLMELMLPFELLLIGGGIYSIASFLMIILTIQGEQNLFLLIYSLTTVIALFISNPLISSLKIYGASILYLFICVSLCLLSSIISIVSYRKKKNCIK